MESSDVQEEHDFFSRSLYQSMTLIDPTWQTHERYQKVLTFKTYQQGERVPLYPYPSLALGDARWSFPAFRDMQANVPCCAELEETSLSTLLYYTYGFSRIDQGTEAYWPFHRFVASARCLFPAELYLCLPHTAHLDAGIYHYDPLHHSLTRLRQGDYLVYLAELLKTNLDGASGVLLISALFGKTASLYKSFAYRLSTQEAGILAGNALLVAAATGLQGQVHYQFLDHQINQLCGFVESDESMLAAVSLFPSNMAKHAEVEFVSAQRSSDTPVAPLQLRYRRDRLPEPEDYATLLAFHQQTCLDTITEERSRPLQETLICDTTQQRLPLASQQPEKAELAEALRQRSSGDINFLPQRKTMPQEVCADILRYALQSYTSDLHVPAGLPLVNLFVVMNNVEGLEPGVYRLCARCGMLHVITPGEQKVQMQTLQTVPNVNAGSANLVCFPVINYAALHECLGDRAYRVCHIETGLVAQRLSVMAAVHGVTVRYSNSFSVARCERLLHLSNTRLTLTPIAELVIGYERPGAFSGQRYHRSLCC